ncbi:MAG: hypothetical protein ABIR66_02210 [Saprospiraceae bacterium]
MDQTEIANKHFTNILSQAIPPVKLETAIGLDVDALVESLEKFWQFKGQKYYDSYQSGRLVATGQNKTNINTTLNDVATLVEVGIKNANTKADTTSENLRDHFILLSQAMKVIASALNAIYAQESHDKALTVSADHQELLAVLSGYITTKIYGQK